MIVDRDGRKKERKQTRDGGGGQGPHLHEQDFGRTIRGTGGALLLLTDRDGQEATTRKEVDFRNIRVASTLQSTSLSRQIERRGGAERNKKQAPK